MVLFYKYITYFTRVLHKSIYSTILEVVSAKIRYHVF